MPLTVSNQRLEEILSEFKKSSDTLANRLVWLTVALVLLTVVLIVLTVWVAVNT